tara:strand:+ start:1003 stop:2004 length:1002 start_codon:yes stop_codon:yes gene_type:complete
MANFYDVSNPVRFGGKLPQVPGENNLATKGMVVSFTRLGTSEDNDITITFKAFITTFNDTYVPNWTKDKIYGRGDAVPIFNNTRRKITLGLKVPAVTTGEAYENLAKLQQLVQFLYPSYSHSGNTNYKLITRSPFVRIKFMNLLRSTRDITAPGSDSFRAQFEQYDMAGEGLLGAIVSLNVLHNLEGDDGVIEKGSAMNNVDAVLSKMFEINLDFEPVHEHPLGWDTNGVFGKGNPIQLERTGENASYAADGGLFPYGVSLIDAGTTLQGEIDDLVYDDNTWTPPPDDPEDELDAETPAGEEAAPSEEQEDAAGAQSAEDSAQAASDEVMPSS